MSIEAFFKPSGLPTGGGLPKGSGLPNDNKQAAMPKQKKKRTARAKKAEKAMNDFEPTASPVLDSGGGGGSGVSFVDASVVDSGGTPVDSSSSSPTDSKTD
mgnify:CR=1 FL=1